MSLNVCNLKWVFLREMRYVSQGNCGRSREKNGCFFKMTLGDNLVSKYAFRSLNSLRIIFTLGKLHLLRKIVIFLTLFNPRSKLLRFLPVAIFSQQDETKHLILNFIIESGQENWEILEKVPIKGTLSNS